MDAFDYYDEYLDWDQYEKELGIGHDGESIYKKPSIKPISTKGMTYKPKDRTK